MSPARAMGPPNPVAPSRRKYSANARSGGRALTRRGSSPPALPRAGASSTGRPLPGHERGMEVVEEDAAAREALAVVRLHGIEPGQELAHAGRLRPPVLPVLEIEVVDDLRHLSERPIASAEPAEHGLEGATVALVGERPSHHVEADLGRTWLLAGGVDEAEAGARVDEAAHQPGRRDAVDVDVPARHPHLSHELAHPAPRA